MPGSSKYLLIQDRLGGMNLAIMLRDWRRAKVSAPAMARMLTMATGVPLSAQAVRYWLADLDEENGEAA